MRTLLALLCFLQLSYVTAQTNMQCAHCNMHIAQNNFKCEATDTEGQKQHFDAIECLVNYLNTKDGNELSRLQVTDYLSGASIAAEKAFYVKSKAIRSPMGGNLAAYAKKADAQSIQKEKGGEVYSWNTLRLASNAQETGAIHHEHHHDRPDAHAPSGIMGDHLHAKGGAMLSFRAMTMMMGGNFEGNAIITDEAIYQRFMVAPQNMTMQMYMLGAMYAPSDKLTLTLMQNIVQKDMDLTARMVMNEMPMFRDFSTSSTGLGDLKLGALVGFVSNDKMSFHLNTVLNVPIGDIENRDDTPMMANVKLSYAMQLGTGTWDATLGGTLKGTSPYFSWGVQQLNTFRTGTNSEGYRFGNLHELHTWFSVPLSKNIGTSCRLSGSYEGSLSGMDDELNPMMVTTASTDNYGGTLLRGALGFNVSFPKLKLVLGSEVGIPVYQNYKGIFMDEDVAINAVAKYSIF